MTETQQRKEIRLQQIEKMIQRARQEGHIDIAVEFVHKPVKISKEGDAYEEYREGNRMFVFAFIDNWNDVSEKVRYIEQFKKDQ